MGHHDRSAKTTTLVVNDYSARWLRRGFPWVYPKEVQGRAPDCAGRTLTIKAKDGAILGRGLSDTGFLAARVYRRDSGPLDEEWLDGLLDRAAALRERILPPETTGYRLVHGENDALPGVRIDRWNHYGVLALDSPAAAPLVPGIVDWMERRWHPRGIFLCHRQAPRNRQSTAPLAPAAGWISGRPPPGDVTVRERGLNFLVRPADGPDVGLYADMRSVRAWLEPYWGGRSVLNTFAYTGAFSVAAAYNGASDVVSVDLSAGVLDRARDNFTANALDPESAEFMALDSFKALDRFRRKGRHFDLVILDPPSFSHTGTGVWSSKKDTPRLVTAASRVLTPDGWLVVASNQGELSPKAFRGLVCDGIRKAGRTGQELLWSGPSPDFPAATWFPEAHYLKVGIWSVF